MSKRDRQCERESDTERQSPTQLAVYESVMMNPCQSLLCAPAPEMALVCPLNEKLISSEKQGNRHTVSKRDRQCERDSDTERQQPTHLAVYESMRMNPCQSLLCSPAPEMAQARPLNDKLLSKEKQRN